MCAAFTRPNDAVHVAAVLSLLQPYCALAEDYMNLDADGCAAKNLARTRRSSAVRRQHENS